MADDLVITPDITIPARDLTWWAARSSGAGGQHVNKVATKVDLRFDLAGTSALGPEVKQRLRVLAARRLDAQGRIVVVSQRYRQRERNLQDARERLAELVRRALRPVRARIKTKPSRGARRRRLETKRRRSERKRARAPVSW